MTSSIHIIKQLLLAVIISFAKASSAIDTAGISRRTTSPICNESESLFQVELKTDNFPRSTSWELLDVNNNNQTVYSVEQGAYNQSNSLHEKIRCILSDSCYKFIIHDSDGDGICCSSGNGYYKLIYEDFFVGEGGEFGSSEESTLFGNACSRTLTPSTSSQPSDLLSSSSTPTLTLSTEPTFAPFEVNIQASRNGLCLDVLNSDISNDIALILSTCSRRSKSQKWFITDDGYIQSSMNRNKCIQVLQQNYRTLSPLVIQDCMNGDDQKWELTDERTTMIKSRKNSNYCFDESGLDAIVAINRCDVSSQDQKWIYMALSDEPSMQPTSSPSPTYLPNEVFIQATNGLCLEMSNSSNSNETYIVLSHCRSSHNSQKWIITSGGLIQSSFNRNKCIQIHKQNYVSGYPIETKDCTDDNKSQKWELTDEGTINSVGNPAYCILQNGIGAIVTIFICDKTSNFLWSYISLSNRPSTQPSPSEISPPSSEPTWSPTSAQFPTASPTEELGLIGIDQYGRRFFPNIPKNADKIVYQQVPNCTSSATDYVGCVSIPRSIFLDPPQWAGKIHFSPPSCNKRKKYCYQGVPMSKKRYSLSEPLFLENLSNGNSIIGFSEAMEFPGSAMDTRSVVVADVDGDGMVDIIVGNRNQNSQLLLNDGDGLFTDADNLSGGFRAINCIAAADMNGDGMVDIIVGNWNQDNQLLLNEGSGSFSGAINLPGGAMATTSIVAADVNGDGLLDIIVGNVNQNNQLLINNGDGSYSEPTNLPGGELTTTTIVASDVNKDGRVDIIIGNWWNQNNQLILNHGNGSYSEPIDLPGGALAATRSMAVADVNGDGMVDLIIGNVGQNQVLMDQGNGNYSEAPIDLPGGTLVTYSIAAADINGDGMVDILIGNMAQSNIAQNNQLLINQGDGSFFGAVDLPGGAMYTYSIAAADVNGDGMMDIIVGNAQGLTNQLLMNEVVGSYSEAFNLLGGSLGTRSIAAADVNRDGLVDILIGNLDKKNQLLVNNGDGTYSEAVDLPGGAMKTTSVTVADVNGDGMMDIIVGNIIKKNQLLIKNDDGTYPEAIDLSGGAMNTMSIAVTDVNGDGMADIVVGNWGQNNQLLLNNGNGTFTTAINLPGGITNTRSIVAADVNGDGMVDIIIGNNPEHNQLVLNKGNDRYSDAIDLPGGAMETWSIAAADIDGDGMVDIIVGNLNQGNQLLLNKGGGRYSEAIDLLPGSALNTLFVAAADVNSDGRVDIIIGNYGQNNQLLMNRGDDSFFESIDLPGGAASTRSLAAADVNGDGMVDIIVGNDNQQNQVLLYDSCPNGGAQLHSRSWCFKCPPFMGRDRSLYGMKNYICRECMPDYIQQVGDSGQCEPKLLCPLGERKIGEDTCSECSSGTYYNNQISRLINDTSTWDADKCVSCPKGTYSSEYLIPIDECFQCSPGTYQPESGSSECFECPLGSFQPDFGEDNCKLCAKGGYCSVSQEVDGGFTACPPGTYNDKLGQSNNATCIKCPTGTYSTISGAESKDTCLPCPAGTYNDELGETPYVEDCRYHFFVSNALTLIYLHRFDCRPN